MSKSSNERRREKRRINRATRNRLVEAGMPMTAYLYAEENKCHPSKRALIIMLRKRPMSPLTTYAWLVLNRSNREW